MIKRSIQEEDILLISTYAPNIGSPKYIKQILTEIKGKTHRKKKIGDINTPLTTMDELFIQVEIRSKLTS